MFQNIFSIFIFQFVFRKIDDLKDDFLNCEVCKLEFDDNEYILCVLLCLYMFCNCCLEKYVWDRFVYCFSCKIQYVFFNNRVLNFFKEYIRFIFKGYVQLKRKIKILCRDCFDSGNVGYFCKNCYLFMCYDCCKVYLRNFIFCDYDILLIDQLINLGIEFFF